MCRRKKKKKSSLREVGWCRCPDACNTNICMEGGDVEEGRGRGEKKREQMRGGVEK